MLYHVNYAKKIVFEKVWHCTLVVQTKFWEITIFYRSLLWVYWVHIVNSGRKYKICILDSWLWSTNCLPKSSFSFYLSSNLDDAGCFWLVGWVVLFVTCFLLFNIFFIWLHSYFPVCQVGCPVSFMFWTLGFSCDIHWWKDKAGMQSSASFP